MPHLKCVPCRIRIRGQQNSAGGAGELCPGCGAPLEPVHDLAELVGLQARRHPDELQAISEAVAMAPAPPPLRSHDV